MPLSSASGSGWSAALLSSGSTPKPGSISMSGSGLVAGAFRMSSGMAVGSGAVEEDAPEFPHAAKLAASRAAARNNVSFFIKNLLYLTRPCMMQGCVGCVVGMRSGSKQEGRARQMPHCFYFTPFSVNISPGVKGTSHSSVGRAGKTSASGQSKSLGPVCPKRVRNRS